MKYFSQETHYTCGVACFRMMLSEFFDNVPEESQLIELLATNDKIGTSPQKIVAAAKFHGLQTIIEENGSVERIDQLINEGYVVLLAISVDVPHLVVYLGNNGNHAFFHDPFFGEKLSRELKVLKTDKQHYPFYRWRVDPNEFKKHQPNYDFTEIASNKLFIAIKK